MKKSTIKKNALVWFRNDLRITDNEVLTEALSNSEKVLCLFSFDPRHYRKNEIGIPKTGSFRAKFLIESVQDLKTQLKGKGGDLYISLEKPEDIIPRLCKTYAIRDVYFQEEVGTEERVLEDTIETTLFKDSISTHKFWGSTLYHKDDLPFPVNQCPEIFTTYRKSLEKESRVRETINIPEIIPGIQNLPTTTLPSLYQLNLQETSLDKRSAFPFKGGETEALKRLENYIWNNELIKTYKETRNGLIGTDYSSKFSPWLAIGAISPRTIYEEILKYEKEKIKNKSTYWLIFELLWRDFFKIQGQKLGSTLFKIDGPKESKKRWLVDEGLFDLWKKGKTGIPFIDANMLELNKTGFMSNRGRQNVASFLTKDLGINWLWGAQYFETMLIDHDPCSNYGNWQYIAGVGADPREDRYFNVLKQSLTYDQNGHYIRKWLPELSPLSNHDLHRAFSLNSKEKKELGLNYPEAVMIPKAFSNYMS